MLVLSRKKNEQIMIGDDIVLTIVDIRGDKVRLGINAPIATPVHRKEVYDAIVRDDELAARRPVEHPTDVVPSEPSPSTKRPTDPTTTPDKP